MGRSMLLASLLVLIAPAYAAAQESREVATSAAPSSHAAPAPADDKARAPAKSKSIFGQAMAELTRSVEQSRAQRSAPAPTATTASPATAASGPASGRGTQIAVQDPAD